MKKIMQWALAALMAPVMLIACGGGGGGTAATGNGSTEVISTMAVNISGPAVNSSATYTQGVTNANGYLDPLLNSHATATLTYVSLCSGRVTSGQCDLLITIVVQDSALQSYPTSTSNPQAKVSYITGGQTYSSVFSASAGTVTLNAIGAVGGTIDGAFNTEVVLTTNTTDTRRLYGTFSVKRDY